VAQPLHGPVLSSPVPCLFLGHRARRIIPLGGRARRSLHVGCWAGRSERLSRSGESLLTLQSSDGPGLPYYPSGGILQGSGEAGTSFLPSGEARPVPRSRSGTWAFSVKAHDRVLVALPGCKADCDGPLRIATLGTLLLIPNKQ
jgi:hypothetical protein